MEEIGKMENRSGFPQVKLLVKNVNTEADDDTVSLQKLIDVIKSSSSSSSKFGIGMFSKSEFSAEFIDLLTDVFDKGNKTNTNKRIYVSASIGKIIGYSKPTTTTATEQQEHQRQHQQLLQQQHQQCQLLSFLKNR